MSGRVKARREDLREQLGLMFVVSNYIKELWCQSCHVQYTDEDIEVDGTSN